MYSIIYLIIALLVSLAAFGFIIGFLKGYVRVNTWASEYLLSALFTVLMGVLASNSGMAAVSAGPFVVVLSVVGMLVAIGICSLFRTIFNRSFARREKLYVRRGAVGFFNRLFGGITFAIKIIVLPCIIIVPILMILDVLKLDAVQVILGDFYTSAAWLKVKPYLMDIIIIGILQLSIRHGFSNGISSALWGIIVLAMSIGVGYLSFYLVFVTPTFDLTAASLAANLTGAVSQLQVSAEIAVRVAKVIIMVALFIILVIVVIILSALVSRVLRFARLGSAFYVMDGIMGATVMFTIMFALIMFVGYLVEPLSELSFMGGINSYFDGGAFAKYFYTQNLLYQFGVPELIPLKQWLT